VAFLIMARETSSSGLVVHILQNTYHVKVKVNIPVSTDWRGIEVVFHTLVLQNLSSKSFSLCSGPRNYCEGEKGEKSL